MTASPAALGAPRALPSQPHGHPCRGRTPPSADLDGKPWDPKRPGIQWDGSPFPRILEAWPGGRWFRDLSGGGNKAGHLWGHVQVIKPPTLLEICGPLFMSYPAISHVQYRLATENSATRLKFIHRAIGLIDPKHAEGVDMGWGEVLENVRKIAERRNRG